MKTLALAMLAMGIAGLATDAEASHCKSLSKAYNEMTAKKAQVSRAEARDDMDAACKLQKQYVALARKAVTNIKLECFHGNRKLFENGVLVAEALEEMYCNWGDDFDDDGDF